MRAVAPIRHVCQALTPGRKSLDLQPCPTQAPHPHTGGVQRPRSLSLCSVIENPCSQPVAIWRLWTSCKTAEHVPDTQNDKEILLSTQFWETISWLPGGFGFLEGCGRAAGHPERQESLSPYNIGKRFHGHLAALDPVESCSRAARHPKWQGNLGLYKLEAILAIWRPWTSWKAACELADPRNDKEISFCIARGRDYPGQLTALDLLEGCR